MSFKDKIVVVTGGAYGISHATAKKFAVAGATVCIGDIAKEKGEAAAIRGQNQKAEYFAIDLTDYASIKPITSPDKP